MMMRAVALNRRTTQRKGWGVGLLTLTIALLPGAAIAQESNFGRLALNANTSSGTMRGSTGGSASLPAIVSNNDRHNHKCLGYGDPKPDHVLILEKPFANLTLRVRSNTDTTLVVQGPDGVVRCGDDTGNSRNASISDDNWKAGTYRIWVGTANPGTQQDYTLTVQP